MCLRCKMTGGEIATPQSKIRDFVQLPSQGEPRGINKIVKNQINPKKEVDLLAIFGYNTIA